MIATILALAIAASAPETVASKTTAAPPIAAAVIARAAVVTEADEPVHSIRDSDGRLFIDFTSSTAVTALVAGAPAALRAQKRLIRRWEESGMTAAIEAGVDAFVAAYRTPEPADYTARFFAARARANAGGTHGE